MCLHFFAGLEFKPKLRSAEVARRKAGSVDWRLTLAEVPRDLPTLADSLG